IVTRDEYNVLQDRSIGHYTHEKNGLCAAAGLAGIEAIERERLVDNAKTLGEYTFDRLIALQEKHTLIGNVTGQGLHLGLELVRDRKSKEKAVEESERVMFKCLEKGLSFKVIAGNVLTLRPALTTTRDEMDLALAILDQSLEEVERFI
ncbi:MAG: aminotransferase class III-fold pyridoxal phosphate-dependent enzyme, partial [Desulfohalobiaceae bacterium]|nr:aminotransferase class III-fold pyridoxal phosphate-dependent enzyme [Desulfohalobiaceae bacterium]